MAQNQISGVRKFMEKVSRYGDWPSHIALGLLLLGIAYWRGSKRLDADFCGNDRGLRSRRRDDPGREDYRRPGTAQRRKRNPVERAETQPALQLLPVRPHRVIDRVLRDARLRLLADWRRDCFAFPLLIAFSRMYVGAHHLSDVVAGALLGVAYRSLRRASNHATIRDSLAATHFLFVILSGAKRSRRTSSFRERQRERQRMRSLDKLGMTTREALVAVLQSSHFLYPSTRDAISVKVAA